MIRKKLQENTDELSKVFRKLLMDYGLTKTLELTGLNPTQLFDRLGPVVINSDLANEMIPLLLDYKLLTDKVGHYKIGYDSLEGTVHWEYYNHAEQERMYALCTPYWDGSLFTPIDCEYYSRYGEENYKQFQEISFKGPEEFININQLINWYEKQYIPKVYNKLNEFLMEYRNSD